MKGTYPFIPSNIEAFGVRWLVLSLGIWNQPDPIGAAGSGNNLYQLEGGNTVDHVDFNGLQTALANPKPSPGSWMPGHRVFPLVIIGVGTKHPHPFIWTPYGYLPVPAGSVIELTCAHGGFVTIPPPTPTAPPPPQNYTPPPWEADAVRDLQAIGVLLISLGAAGGGFNRFSPPPPPEPPIDYSGYPKYDPGSF